MSQTNSFGDPQPSFKGRVSYLAELGQVSARPFDLLPTTAPEADVVTMMRLIHTSEALAVYPDHEVETFAPDDIREK